MVKSTWLDHVDHTDICEASVMINDITQRINKKKKEIESKDRVIQIQESLTGKVPVCHYYVFYINNL